MSHLIETPRLALRTLGPEPLRLSLDGDRVGAERSLGARLPPDWPREPQVLAMRLVQLEQSPEREPWLTRVIELRSENRIIGLTGFHGPPGADALHEWAPGGVELGYSIDPEWRRRGLAEEACRGLMAWASREQGVRRFVLSIAPTNRASTALARKLGFAKIGAWRHEVRGTEDVYRLEAPRERLSPPAPERPARVRRDPR